jgi:hypothetical protein
VPFIRESAYAADSNGARLRTASGTQVYTRALRAQLSERPEVFASEMPCAPATRWLARSVRAGRAGAHVDTTAAFYRGKVTGKQVKPNNGLRTGNPPAGRE